MILFPKLTDDDHAWIRRLINEEKMPAQDAWHYVKQRARERKSKKRGRR